MSTFDDFMIGQAVKNDEERDKLRSRALRAEAREKELREALRQFGRHSTMCNREFGLLGCDCGWASAEKLLAGEPEKEEG